MRRKKISTSVNYDVKSRGQNHGVGDDDNFLWLQKTPTLLPKSSETPLYKGETNR